MDAFVTDVQFVNQTKQKKVDGKLVDRTTIIGYCLMGGPDSDKIAKILKIPKSYKKEKGWLLSKRRRKKAIKLGAIPWILDLEEQNEEYI